ncbi:T3SS effector HopA1 family protein [Enhygromyxa salina]|uniref:Uncharacterized protein n=1 Tax=Enhygromyxa salina TaxID=215803 RepID=A0A2S9YTI6_9BACT|nr:T3SS effector HopA1 family protein [Enhygromyxa salina]PRQ08342.1 hypothetical protein ENSA7_19690 [Enhygromyxa salina]
MSTPQEDILAHLCEVLSIKGEHDLRVDDVEVDVEPLVEFTRPIASDLGETGPRDRLTLALWGLLYQGCYMHGRRLDAELTRAVMSTLVARPPSPVALVSSLREDLQTIADGTAGWDPGWEVYQVERDGLVRVRKGDCHQVALAGEYLKAAAPGVQVRVGATVDLRVTVGTFEIQPGYYHVLGRVLGDTLERFDCVRLYFNTRPGSVQILLRALVAALNRLEIPFRAKTPCSAVGYARTDATVLYVARVHAPLVLDLVVELPDCDRLLDPGVPMFSLPVAAGIGLADDPGAAESFGTNRCRLVAQALADAWRERGEDPDQRMRAIRAAFASEGLDLARPHLGPGLAEIQPWPQTLEILA